MAQQTKKVRHVQKHDVEANWLKATGFTPLAGEIIIYDKDELHNSKRVKIGDGITNINDLPFQPDQAIVDVFDRLPENDINTGVFYRLITGTFVFNQSVQSKMFCYCVDALPNEGFPALSGDLSSISNATITAYYSVLDNDVYGYVSEQLSIIFGVSAGWHPCAVLMEAVGESFGGIIVNIKDDPMDNTFRLLLEYKLYYYNGSWESLKEIIQPDWNQTDDTQPDYIKNKPDVVQADWDIANESDPAAIKNKPFGMVEQMVNVVLEAEYDFYRPNETTTDIIYFSASAFNNDQTYYVWFNDIYLGTAKPGENIEIPNGQFYFISGAMVITGGNYPEGKYKVHIMEKQVIAKKLDSQWLNIQDNIYNGDMTDPVNGQAVAIAVSNVGSAVGNLQTYVNTQVIPAIGPIPTEADNGKLLQVEDGQWVASNELPNKMASMETHILPEIKENDNNKILKVVEGNQKWVEHKIMTAIGTATVASGENNIITLHDFDIDTPLIVSSTGTKVFCAGKNWFSLDNMTYIKGNYTPGDNPNSFTVTNNYVELSFNTPLPVGQYRVSTKAVLHDDTSLPLLKFFDNNNVSIAQTSATGTSTSYSPKFVYRTEYDRYGVTFYVSAPIAKMTVYAGAGNYPGANSSFTEFAISLADDTTDWSYPGNYNGSIYDIKQDAQIAVSSNPMYIFSDDLQPCSIAYYISDVLTELPDVTLDDNGKVLGIQQGRPAWITHSGGNTTLPTITEEDNYKFLRVIDGEAKWADNTMHILEPHKVSGSMVLINDEQAIDLPIQVESETATKVYIGGKNLFPTVDAFGNPLFNNNNEFIIDASTKTTNWYRDIQLPMQYPVGSYRIGFEGNNAYNENHASFGTPIGNTTAMCRFLLGTTTVAWADVPINRSVQTDSHVNLSSDFSEYQPFDKIRIYSGAGNTGSLDVDAVLKNVCLYYDNESATTYTPATGKFYELPLPNLKLQDLPTRIFGNDGSELTATYYHGADMSTEEIAGMMLPEFTSDDNNKVLSIKNDKVAWTELPNDNSNIIPPDYYATHLAEQTALINTYLKKASTNGDAFVFITDQHLEGSTPRNAGHSIELLKYINDNTKVRKLFFGGDICITEDRLAQHVEKVSKIFEGDIAYAMGNHEYDTVADTGPRLTPEALCYIHDINKPKQIGNTERHYYYIDNPQQKIRYVVVNNWEHNPDTSAGHDGMVATDLEVQASWLTNTAFNVEAGWGIILFCHQFFNNPNASAPASAALPFQTAIDTYNGQGEIIAVFHGHIHQDMVNRTGTGVPAISVISDAYKDTYLSGSMQDNFIPREVGTITEQAFDVAIVDRYERKIYCVRIGCPALDGSGDANAQAVSVREVDFRAY